MVNLIIGMHKKTTAQHLAVPRRQRHDRQRQDDTRPLSSNELSVVRHSKEFSEAYSRTAHQLFCGTPCKQKH